VRSKTFALAAVMLLVASAGIVAMTPTATAAQSGDFTYTVINGNEVEITDYTGSSSSVTIPGTIDGKPVTSIGEHAFHVKAYEDGWEGITSITLPDSIRIIKDYAFYSLEDLRSINIPDGVISIGYYAIASTAITSVTLPDSLTHLGDRAFSYCESLTSVVIPGSLTSIGNSVFRSCKSLTSIVIPDSVTSIGDWAFAYSGLSSVTVGNGVTSIGTGAFRDCKSLASITFHGSAPSVGADVFTGSSSVVVRYHQGAAGFTSPTWNGVPSQAINPIQYTAPTGNLAAGTYWSHQLSTTPGVSITVSGAGTSWIQVGEGMIYGVPPSDGEYEVTVLMTAPNHISQEQTFTLTVVPELVLTNSPAAGAIAYVVG
jgi:hypothetical protein